MHGLWRKGRVSVTGYRVSLWGDENILELALTVEQPCDSTKNIYIHMFLKG